MTYSPDRAAGAGDPRRGPRRYGPSATPAPAQPNQRPRPRSDEPYLGGLDPDDELLRHVTGPAVQYRPAQYRPDPTPPRPATPPTRRAQPVRASSANRDHNPPPTRAMPAVPGGQPGPGPNRAWSQFDEPTVAQPAPGRTPGSGYPPQPVSRTAGTGRTPPPRPPAPPRTGGPAGPGDSGRRRTPAAIVAGRIIAAVLAVAVVLVAGVGYYVRSNVNSASAVSDAATDAGEVGVAFTGGLNILLVGSDSRTDAQGNALSAEELAALRTEETSGTNTDTIMVLHIPEGGGKATAVSLPRDTWIDEDVVAGIPGPYSDGSSGDYKPNKINSFYGTAKAYTEERLVAEGVTDPAERERVSNEAGRVMLTKVVQKFTGLKIDHYAEVNLLGFYLLSEAIGGVPVCLNNAVDDPFSGAKFPAGQQEISGSDALAFVRQRHGLPQGDLDRVKRQQVFLAAAAQKVLSAGTLTNPGKVTDLVDTVKRSVIFDKGFDLFDFAEQMRNLSAGNVTFTTIPITGSEPSTDTDALGTDPAQIKAFFAALDGGQSAGTGSESGSASTGPGTSAPADVDPSLIVVDAQNGSGLPGAAAGALDVVEQAGFVRGDASDFDGPSQSTTTIRYPTGAQDAAAAVQAALGVGDLVEDPDVAEGHVEVVVGADLSSSGLRAPAGALVQGQAHIQPAVQSAADTDAPTTAEEIVAGQPGCIN